VTVTASPNQSVIVAWGTSCSVGSSISSKDGTFTARTPVTRGLTRLSLYTNEVMTENQAIYAHLGYREVARHTEDGYRRVYMEKLL
jgi:hypothetical protein